VEPEPETNPKNFEWWGWSLKFEFMFRSKPIVQIIQ